MKLRCMNYIKVAPNWEFNIEEEQKLLVEHDRYIFQFPLYWYSSPPLLKMV